MRLPQPAGLTGETWGCSTAYLRPGAPASEGCMQLGGELLPGSNTCFFPCLGLPIARGCVSCMGVLAVAGCAAGTVSATAARCVVLAFSTSCAALSAVALFLPDACFRALLLAGALGLAGALRAAVAQAFFVKSLELPLANNWRTSRWLLRPERLYYTLNSAMHFFHLLMCSR